MKIFKIFILSVILLSFIYNVRGDDDDNDEDSKEIEYESRGPCQYCKYCAFCNECRHCPCTSKGPDDLPYCEFSIYI